MGIEDGMSTELNDDVFEYESGGMSQCISGFGRNTIETIRDAIENNSKRSNDADRDEDIERCIWHVQELVRWCRHFNGLCKKNGLTTKEVL